MFVKYLGVGVINTLLTFFTILLSFSILKIDYNISYCIGFLIGFINSILMNNFYTFKEKKQVFNFSYLKKFTFYFFLAFLISELTLVIWVELFNFNKLMGIVFSMVSYTLSSYVLFKKFVYIR